MTKIRTVPRDDSLIASRTYQPDDARVVKALTRLVTGATLRAEGAVTRAEAPVVKALDDIVTAHTEDERVSAHEAFLAAQEDTLEARAEAARATVVADWRAEAGKVETPTEPPVDASLVVEEAQ